MTDCVPVEITGVEHGELTSANFPSGYANDLEQSWRITVEEGYQIQYFFTEFELEDSYDEDQGGACAYDYVQVSPNPYTTLKTFRASDSFQKYQP